MWIFIFVFYGVVPLLDKILPLDEINPTPAKEKDLRNKYYILIRLSFKIPIYSHFLFEHLFNFLVISYASKNNLTFMQ